MKRSILTTASLLPKSHPTTTTTTPIVHYYHSLSSSLSTSTSQHHHTIKNADHKDHMIKNLITFNPTIHGNNTNNNSSSTSVNNSKSGGVDLSTVYDFAKQPPSSISLKMIMNFGLKLNKQTLLTSSDWLKEELPKRLGRQIRQLDNLPKGLNLMPSVRLVRDWYMQSFNDLYTSKKPKTFDEELQFTKMLETVYTRHNPTLISVARGVNELKSKMKESIYLNDANFDLAEFTELHQALDAFYINRIGMRMLIGQHLALHEQLTKPIKDYSGLICMNTNPYKIAKDAAEDASELCRMTYGDAPHMELIGKLDLQFPYVPSHLYYIFFELLKNSMRAVIENHHKQHQHGSVGSGSGGSGSGHGKKHSTSLPTVQMVIADSADKEHISIKISDQGMGIPRKDMHKIWSYLYTTANIMDDVSKIEEFSDSHAPLAGLGYGLPLSRLYAKYWGGDLTIQSLEGYGTDAYIYLHCLGDKEEPLP